MGSDQAQSPHTFFHGVIKACLRVRALPAQLHKGELTALPPSMKLLGTAFFFLAVLCVCTVGEDGIQTPTVKTATSSVASKAEGESVTTRTSQATTSAAPVLTTTAVNATNETTTSSPMSSSPNATSQAAQGTTEKPSTVISTASTSLSTTTTTQASGAQLPQNESLGAAPTTGQSFISTVSPKTNTSASGTSGLPVSSPTHSTKPTSESPKSNSGNQTHTGSNISYSNVILPIVITLIVITLSVFSLVALYKMCQKKTPERQENGAEQAQSDKEGVKLLSVKTTSSETGEHSSHGKNKTRQIFTSQQ
ncbi:endomucin isoform X1 [Ammospiza nelsoni]|uniref:endomucin isoform X1 n=1 Tax=Ammospiza caudacuta TaxID=2857398 RepID=UPI002739C505|nr:endomucin isoform X1 [Ammospiza caudacuta]XP_059326573.1 endomucin isoform X1 [Ammospiza nelsoni]